MWGGESYYILLKGPSLVVGNVLDKGDGSYDVRYFVAEAGRYGGARETDVGACVWMVSLRQSVGLFVIMCVCVCM